MFLGGFAQYDYVFLFWLASNIAHRYSQYFQRDADQKREKIRRIFGGEAPKQGLLWQFFLFRGCFLNYEIYDKKVVYVKLLRRQFRTKNVCTIFAKIHT